MTTLRRWIGVAVCFLLLKPSLYAVEGPALSLTIDGYVKRALDEGIHGKENAWSLQTAGYTREIAFRRTDSPTLTAASSHERVGTDLEGTTSTGETELNNLTMNETTPLGTVINGQYGYTTNSGANSTLPLSGGGGARPLVTASASQPLFIFVKNPVWRTRRLAMLSFADAQSTFQSTALSLRSQARLLYYTVMQNEEAVKVAERKVQASQKLLDITDALVNAGKSAPVETMRAKITLQTDQRALDDAKVQVSKAMLNAKNFIYVPLDLDVRFITELEFAPLKLSQRRLVDYGLLHQPALEQLQRGKERARLQLEQDRDVTRPSLALSGTYNYSDIQTEATHAWTWTAGANWLFFDSFVTRDTVRSDRIGEWVADLNLKDGERTAEVNIRNAYLDVKNAEQQIADFQFSLEQARHNVDVVRLRFQNGLERLIDVFDAENEMRDLDNEYLGLLVQFNQSKDQLSELIGADVETVNE